MSSRKVSEYLLCVQELKSSLHIMRRAARLLNRIFIDLCIQQLVNWLQKRIAAPWGAAVWILLFGSAVLGAVYGVSALPAPSQNPAGLFLAAPPLLFAALLLHRPSYVTGACAYTQVGSLRQCLRRQRRATFCVLTRLALLKRFAAGPMYRCRELSCTPPEEIRRLSQKTAGLLFDPDALLKTDEWLPLLETFCLTREKRNAEILRQVSLSRAGLNG